MLIYICLEEWRQVTDYNEMLVYLTNTSKQRGVTLFMYFWVYLNNYLTKKDGIYIRWAIDYSSEPRSVDIPLTRLFALYVAK